MEVVMGDRRLSRRGRSIRCKVCVVDVEGEEC